MPIPLDCPIMLDVRDKENDPNFPVQIKTDEFGERWIVAYNESGHNWTEVSLDDVLKWNKG